MGSVSFKESKRLCEALIGVVGFPKHVEIAYMICVGITNRFGGTITNSFNGDTYRIKWKNHGKLIPRIVRDISVKHSHDVDKTIVYLAAAIQLKHKFLIEEGVI